MAFSPNAPYWENEHCFSCKSRGMEQKNQRVVKVKTGYLQLLPAEDMTKPARNHGSPEESWERGVGLGLYGALKAFT